MLRLLLLFAFVACVENSATQKKTNETVITDNLELPRSISLYPYDSVECNDVAREVLKLPNFKSANVKRERLGKHEICFTETKFNDFKMNYRLYLLSEAGHQLIFSTQEGTGLCDSHGIEFKFELAANKIPSANESQLIILENLLEKECKGTWLDMTSDSNLYVYDLAKVQKRIFEHKLVDSDGSFLKINSITDFEDKNGKKYKLMLSGDQYSVAKE